MACANAIAVEAVAERLLFSVISHRIGPNAPNTYPATVSRKLLSAMGVRTRSVAMNPDLRFRLSTAFICIGLLFFPWSADLLPYPSLFGDGGGTDSVFRFALEVAPSMFAFGFLFAFGTLVWFSIRRRWVGAGQALGEMTVCVFAVLLTPAY
jgi:hypothetical protein